MWIATVDGFYSAVQSTEDHNDVVVRARHRKDIDALQAFLGREWGNEPATILAYEPADYPWRIVVRKAVWSDYLASAGVAIDYPNFKARIDEDDQKRHDVYSGVWAVLLRLEELPGALRGRKKMVKERAISR